MVGFKDLLRRLKVQDQMARQHKTRLDISEDITEESNYSNGQNYTVQEETHGPFPQNLTGPN